MAEENVRDVGNGVARPGLNGRAYPVTEHIYDVVVVGAGGSGLRATLGCAAGGPQDRLRHQGVPDALAHGRRPRRHRRCARQHGPRRLAVAHVRHREGRRLAGRPGRHRVSVPQRHRCRLRARALRRALQPHRGRAHLSASVRRHDHRVRRRPAGATHGRRRRPHRTRHAAHALRPVAQALGAVLRRVFRHRPDHGPGRRLRRRRGAVPGGRHAAPLPRQEDHPGDRRLRSRLLHLHLGAHLHRRRQRHGAARRAAAAGHGVRAVPPDRRLHRRRADHGRARAARAAISPTPAASASWSAMRRTPRTWPRATWSRAP